MKLPLRCKTCRRAFRRAGSLQAHVNRHREERELHERRQRSAAAKPAVAVRRVIAEQQPAGDFLVMAEDGSVSGYVSRSAVELAVRRHDAGVVRRSDALVATVIEWRLR